MFIRKSRCAWFLNREDIVIFTRELKMGVLTIKLMQLIDDTDS